MVIELKLEQQQLLDRAARSGMNPEELLDQAFAVIREQYRNEEWMLTDRESIAEHIAEGFAQAKRGELVSPEDAMAALRDRRAKKHIA